MTGKSHTSKGLIVLKSSGKHKPLVAKQQTMVNKMATTFPKSAIPLLTAAANFLVLHIAPHLQMF